MSKDPIEQYFFDPDCAADTRHRSNILFAEIMGVPAIDVVVKKRYDNGACAVCQFLGQHGKYDLWFCPSQPTVFARYGSSSGACEQGFSNIEDSESLALAAHESLRRRLIGPQYLLNYVGPSLSLGERVSKLFESNWLDGPSLIIGAQE